MKKLWAAVTAGLLVAMVAGAAMAQPAERRPGRTATSPARDEGMGQRIVDRLVRELNLSQEQQAQLRQVLQTHRQNVENWRKENWPRMRQLTDQIAEAKKAGDQEKVKAAQQDLRKIAQSRRALHEALVKQLTDVLTPEQMEKGKEIIRQAWERPGVRALAAFNALSLTPEQKDKAKAIFQEARQKAQQTQDPQQKREIWQAAAEKVKTEVLTDDQRWQLDHMKKFNHFFEMIQSLKLTDEQKKQIQAIRQDARTQVEKATAPEQKREIVRAALKKINDTVLTEEQRQQVRQFRERSMKERRAGKHPSSAPTGEEMQ